MTKQSPDLATRVVGPNLFSLNAHCDFVMPNNLLRVFLDTRAIFISWRMAPWSGASAYDMIVRRNGNGISGKLRVALVALGHECHGNNSDTLLIKVPISLSKRQ
jgi:hypothetical protein